jgi:hypothetical protein
MATETQATMKSDLRGDILVSTGVEWLQTATHTLFVRQCYVQLYAWARAQTCAGVFIVGTPGVGKSCFLDYALHRLREEEGKSVMYISGPQRRVFIYRPDGGVEGFPLQEALSDNMADNVDFVLYDPPEDVAHDVVTLSSFRSKPFIVAMSPDAENCKKLRKDAGFVDLYMGPTTLAEAQNMRNSCHQSVSTALVGSRFAILGGIPRSLFKPLMVIPPATPGGLATTLDQALISRQGIQKKALEDAAVEPRRIDDGQVTSNYKGLWSLYHLWPKVNADATLDFSGFTIELCCNNARSELRRQLMTQSVADLWRAYNTTADTLGTLRGIRYEAYAHKKITTEGLTGTAVSLTQNGTGTTTFHCNIPALIPIVSLPDNNLGAPLVNAVNVASNQALGSYLLPILPNFPVLDAMYVPPGTNGRGVMLQMKAGCSKPLAGDSATTLFAVSHEGNLLFIVPDEMHMRRKLAWSGRAVGPNAMKHFRYVLNEH